MTDTDRELLEFAAKAAGYHVRWVDAPTSFNYEGFLIKTGKKLPNGLDAEIMWNPLTKSGDALELAVELRMFDTRRFMVIRLEETRKDPTRSDLEITRRAITRAAAEIGKEMK
jgi:hypothetical protein